MNAQDRLVFRAGNRHYALPASRVHELARLPRLTPVPMAPPGLLGIGNVRGEMLAVLSPAGLEGAAPPGDARQLLVLAGDDRLGIAIDAVERSGRSVEVADLPIDDLLARSFPVRARTRKEDVTVSPLLARIVPEERVTLLRMAITDQSFALPAEEIMEVLRVPSDIARLPGADATVIGAIAWQDRTIGVLSLPALLGLGERQEKHETAGRSQQRIIIVAVGTYRLGLLIDRVEGLMQVPTSRIDTVPATLLRGKGEARIRAICRPSKNGKLVSILAADHLLNEARSRDLLASDRRDATADPVMAPEARRVALLPVRIGKHHLAFPVSAIDRITTRPARMTGVAGVPSWFLGVAAIAGEPLPIVDQAMRLTGSPSNGSRQRLLILRAAGQRVGFLVEEARAIIMAESSALLPAPLPETLGDGIFGEVLHYAGQGMDGAMLVVDPDTLMDSAARALLAKGTA